MSFLGSSKEPHSPVAVSTPTWWLDSVRCPAHYLPAKQESHLHPPWGYRVGIQPNLVRKKIKLQKASMWMHHFFRILIPDEIQDPLQTRWFLGENLSQLPVISRDGFPKMCSHIIGKLRVNHHRIIHSKYRQNRCVLCSQVRATKNHRRVGYIPWDVG